jgi:hypothetical protein
LNGIKGQFKRIIGTNASTIPPFIEIKIKNNTHSTIQLLEYKVQRGEKISLRKMAVSSCTELAVTRTDNLIHYS